MNPAMTEQLMAIARRAEAAGHGRKSAVYTEAAADLGISVATLQRRLKAVQDRPARRRRSDAGNSTLTHDEARLIAAYLMESQRRNGKRLASIEDAVEVLRANGQIMAGRVDEETGEFQPLCTATIGRALRGYGLHPEQLRRPSPKMKLASRHPNHVWQIDPSLCVLYYLPAKAGETLQVMEEDRFYKNKPANIRRIEKERVWRYVITDHTSGVIYVHYVLGAESGKNLVDAFIGATQKRHREDPFHGIPRLVMVDPGSANTGAVFRNLCRALGVHLQVNEPGKPWAKGQVEKANDTVERSFEHRMRFMKRPPTSLEEINQAAHGWMRWFNALKPHSRTGKPRYAVWQTITEDQLIVAPEPQVMRELAVNAPLPRKVTPSLTISYRGQTFPVGDIPNVAVGERLLVTRNPWRDDAAQVIYTDEEGRERMQVVEAERANEYGFTHDAPVIGESYRAHADTRIDTERKAVERLAMDAPTDEAAAQSRKKQTTPFQGDVDAMKPITDTRLPDYLPKRGTDLDIQTPKVDPLQLNHVQAAKRLHGRLGNAWRGGEHFQWLQQRYPDGVPEDQLEAIAEALTQRPAAPLRLVGGEA